MPEIPRLISLDSTAALLLEGYPFISRRCRRHGTDAFETRILGQRVVCMTGEEASRLFYGSGRFTRKRAIPRPTLTLLQDFGSVAVLDGDAHRHRKAMFMDLMSRDGIARLVELTRSQWDSAVERWQDGRESALDREAQEVFCRAVCAWTGVPLGEGEERRRASELAAMFDGAGSVGPRQLRGQLARRRGERWIKDVVEGIRNGDLSVREGSPAHTVAWHRRLDGTLLEPETAAVEVINVLRPTVAVSRFVTFAALALHEHPHARERLRSGGDEELHAFVQEVRRTAPFFALTSGRVEEPFRWRGHDFAKGDWVMLDIYGTNRDPRVWEDPDRFDPERFAQWRGDPFTLIPQGGGDFLHGHRCAGEWITIELMKASVRFLTCDIEYGVPEQDLSVPLWRMPSVPRSGFVIHEVRRRDRSLSRVA
jgi:fatty-acid peroxygenase